VRILLLEPGNDPLLDLVEVPPGLWRGVAEEFLKDTPVDRRRRPVLPAVDVGRDDPAGLLGDRGKDPADGGGLSGPGGTAEDCASRAPAPEGRPDEIGKFPDLGVAVVEVLGDKRELEDVRISERGSRRSGEAANVSYVRAGEEVVDNGEPCAA
jgi:hypothetical protein